MRALTEGQRVPLVAGLAALAILVLWWLALWSPRQKAYDTARKNAEAQQALVQQLQAQLSQLRSQRSQAANGATAAQLAVERAAIPPDPELSQLILQVNGAANDSGVDFLGISPSQPGAALAPSGPGALPGPYPIQLSINVAGGYYQVLDFMNRLDSLPRLVVITTIGLNPGGANGAELSFTLAAKAFTSSAYTTGTSAPATTATTVAGTGSSTSTTSAPPTTKVAP